MTSRVDASEVAGAVAHAEAAPRAAHIRDNPAGGHLIWVAVFVGVGVDVFNCVFVFDFNTFQAFGFVCRAITHRIVLADRVFHQPNGCAYRCAS